MGDYKTKISLEGNEAASVLDSLESKAQRLEQTLQRIASSLGTKAFASPEFQAGLRELSATQGAMGAVKASAGLTGRDLEQAVAGGAKLGAGALRDIPAGLGASAAMQAAGQIAEQAGAGYQRPFSVSSFTEGVIRQARAESATTLRMPAAAAADVTSAMPAVMSSAVTMQMQAATPRTASGTVLPSGFESSGPYTSAQLGVARPTFDPNKTAQFDVQAYNAARLRQATRASQQRSLAFGVGIGAVSDALGRGLSLYASQTATGEYDPMAASELRGGIIGGSLGAIAGGLLSPENPGIGMGVGYLAGQQVGAAAAGAAAAPFMRNRTMALTLAATAARLGVQSQELIQGGRRDHGLFNNGAMSVPPGMGLSAIARAISEEGKTPEQIADIRQGTYFGTNIISGPKLAETFANVAAGLLQSGEDPQHALPYTARLARKYGLAAPAMSAVAESVLGTRTRLGNNATDILYAHGPMAYGVYEDSIGGPDLTPMQREGYGASQYFGRQARVAQLRPRGAGQAQMDALQSRRDLLRIMPFGTESETYAENEAQIRQAGRQAFDERSIVNYEIPRARLDALRDSLNALPYSPGGRFVSALASIRMSSAQMGEIRQFMGKRRAAGQLSEEEELDLTRQYGALQVSRYRDLAEVSEGADTKLFALQAGRPAGAGRIDSVGLAAVNIGRIGFPRRGYGAANGKQLKQQNDFIRELGLNEGDLGPWSSGVGGASFGGNSHSDQILSQILSTLQQIASGNGPIASKRPGETRGRIGGDLDARQGRLGGGNDRGYN